MKKSAQLILILFLLCGCSVPTAATYRELHSFTKEEKKIRAGFAKKKEILIKDFRGNSGYEEDIAALKEEVEKYISSHPELSEEAKNNLRALKVTAGATKDEVELLLGKPDKIGRASGRAKYGASEIWIYKVNKINAFTVFIIPVFFPHEGYYLYLKEGGLVGIERHYLAQTVEQSPGPGIFQKTEETKQ